MIFVFFLFITAINKRASSSGDMLTVLFQFLKKQQKSNQISFEWRKRERRECVIPGCDQQVALRAPPSTCLRGSLPTGVPPISCR